jgi:hypothetical protein
MDKTLEMFDKDPALWAERIDNELKDNKPDAVRQIEKCLCVELDGRALMIIMLVSKDRDSVNKDWRLEQRAKADYLRKGSK